MIVTYPRLLLVFVLVVAVAAPPAVAGKKKIRNSFVAQGIPYPVTSGINDVGCQEGMEGVHKTHHAFTAPADGFLTASMKDFTGDWDIVLLDQDGHELDRSDNDNVLSPPSERVEAALHRGDVVTISPCNWLGEPQVTVRYQFVFHR